MGQVGLNPNGGYPPIQQRQQQMQSLLGQFGVNASASSVMDTVRSQLQASGQQPGQPGQAGQPGAFMNALNNTLVQDGMNPNSVQQFDQAFKQQMRPGGHHRGGHHHHHGGVNGANPAAATNPLTQPGTVAATNPITSLNQAATTTVATTDPNNPQQLAAGANYQPVPPGAGLNLVG